MRFSRRGIALQLFAPGLSLGFCAMIAQGTMLAFGEVGLLTPELAAWTVPLLLTIYVVVSARPSWLTSPGRVRAGRLPMVA